MGLPLLKEIYEELQERENIIPENYKRSSILEVDTAHLIKPKEIFSRTTISHTAYLLRLQRGKDIFSLSRPISASIYHDDDFFFAENERLAVCGTGMTPEEALKDLSLHIIHFFHYYKDIAQESLTGDALRLKEIYKNLLIEKKNAG